MEIINSIKIEIIALIKIIHGKHELIKKNKLIRTCTGQWDDFVRKKT